MKAWIITRYKIHLLKKIKKVVTFDDHIIQTFHKINRNMEYKMTRSKLLIYKLQISRIVIITVLELNLICWLEM